MLKTVLNQVCASLLLVTSLMEAPRAAESSQASLRLVPCTLPQLSRPARYGALDVAENPQRPEGRHILVAIAVIPAAVGPGLPDRSWY
jgi:hypothetical protein